MCGRTTSYTPPERLAEIYDAELAPEVHTLPAGPHWNVGPTNNLFGLAAPRKPAADDAALVIDAYRWGLIPSWSDRAAAGNLLFNARSETVASKPAFRKAFRSRRLAVVVDGFYEWRKDPGGPRQPFYFHRGDGYPLTFAGLWEIWKDPQSGRWVRSCTIITTTAGPDMEGIHNRMPVILERRQLDAWIRSGATGEARLMKFLKPAPAGTLVGYPVDPRVGNVRHDDPDLLQPDSLRHNAFQQQTLLS
jgi:putative SOS response-associated peptidase YedK